MVSSGSRPGSARRGGVPGAPPSLPSCHLCGRQFGTASLAIHLKACTEKWEREHPGKRAPPPVTAIPVGAPVGSKEWAAFNTTAQEAFEENTMESCPYCQRTFLPDRLAVHLRTCGKGNFANPKPGPSTRGDGASLCSESAATSDRSSPLTQSLPASAAQHRPSSASRAFASPDGTASGVEASPSARPPLTNSLPTSSARPTTPSSVRPGSARRGGVPGAPPSLPSCHLCGRQFGTASLAIHLKACTEKWEREHPGKRAPPPVTAIPVGAPVGSKEWAAFNTTAQEAFEENTMESCPYCQRTFLPDRLAVHLRTCGKGNFANPKPRPLSSARPSASGDSSLDTLPSEQLNAAAAAAAEAVARRASEARHAAVTGVRLDASQRPSAFKGRLAAARTEASAQQAMMDAVDSAAEPSAVEVRAPPVSAERTTLPAVAEAVEEAVDETVEEASGGEQHEGYSGGSGRPTEREHAAGATNGTTASDPSLPSRPPSWKDDCASHWEKLRGRVQTLREMAHDSAAIADAPPRTEAAHAASAVDELTSWVRSAVREALCAHMQAAQRERQPQLGHGLDALRALTREEAVALLARAEMSALVDALWGDMQAG